MFSSPRFSPVSLSLTLALALGLAGCGDDSTAPDPVPAGGGDPTAIDTPGPDADGTGTAPDTGKAPVQLPELGPLTQGLATEILHAPFGRLDELDPDVVRQVLLMMARLGDRDVVGAVRGELLLEDSEGWADTEAAAIGLLVLHTLGEAGTDRQILDLAKAALDAEEGELENVAIALDALPGAAPEPLLMRIVESNEDELGTTEALRALARRRTAAARDLMKRVAASRAAGEAEYTDEHHYLAVAGLLGLGDPAGMDQIDRWAAQAGTAPDLDDTLVALGIPGLTEAVPAIRRIMDKVLEEPDNVGFEPSSACIALSEIFRDGGGEEHRDLIRGYMNAEGAQAEVEGRLALLRTGDTSVLADLVEGLKPNLAAPSKIDPENTVATLVTLAERDLARAPELEQLLAVGAQSRPDDKTPEGTRDRMILLNCASAYAYLTTRK